MKTLNLTFIGVGLLCLLFPSCQLIPDLDELPSIEIISVNTELDSLVVVAEITTDNDYTIDEYGFELREFATNRLAAEEPRRIISQRPTGNRITLAEDLELEQSYVIQAYLRLGSEYIYSDTITVGTDGLRVSTSYEIRENQVLMFGNISGLPRDYSITEHGYCWVTLDEKVPNAQSRFFGVNSADNVLYLGEKIGSGEFTDEILELARGKYSYIVPFAIYQDAEVYGNMIEVFIGDFWAYKEYYNKPQSPGQIASGVSFVIGDYAYLGTGEKTEFGTNTARPTNQFWRFDPSVENLDSAWTRIEDFPGKSRYQAVAFTVNGKAYVGLGEDQTNCFNDFYEYTPGEGWVRKADFPNYRIRAAAFSVGNYGYVGTGYHNCSSFSRRLYEYDPMDESDGVDENGNPLGKWGRKALLPSGGGRAYAVGFEIDNYGYITTGLLSSGYSRAIYQFDPSAQDSINEMGRPYGRFTRLPNDFAGVPRQAASGFVINNKVYVGLGDNVRGRNGTFNDVFLFDPQTQEWKKKSDVGIENRHFSTSFSIAGKGYIYGGFFSLNQGSQASAGLYIYTPNE